MYVLCKQHTSTALTCHQRGGRDAAGSAARAIIFNDANPQPRAEADWEAPTGLGRGVFSLISLRAAEHLSLSPERRSGAELDVNSEHAEGVWNPEHVCSKAPVTTTYEWQFPEAKYVSWTLLTNLNERRFRCL